MRNFEIICIPLGTLDIKTLSTETITMKYTEDPQWASLIISSKGGSDLKEMTNKRLTDGKAHAKTIWAQ